jgi:hypothetical protein
MNETSKEDPKGHLNPKVLLHGTHCHPMHFGERRMQRKGNQMECPKP